LENPDSAQEIAALVGLKPVAASCAGENNTNRASTAAAVTPRSPTAAAGTGSTISPTMTVTNSARYHQACCGSPGGGGSRTMTKPIASGRIVASVRPFVPGRAATAGGGACSRANARE
jgi:hypothetical protein